MYVIIGGQSYKMFEAGHPCQKEAISEVIIEVTNCNQSMCVLQVPSNDPEPNEHIERNEYTLKNVRNLNERNPSAPL